MNAMRKNRKQIVSIYFFTFLAFIFILSSCGGSDRLFHLEGHFQNINQGEFYIYDLEHGTKDTIALRDGRFTYAVALTDTTTLALLFPNYSELPIIAQPNAKVRIEGDVSHLREATVKGTKANEQMTHFRQEVNDMTPQKATSHAEQFIIANPRSPLCNYLLRRYFILCAEPDYKKAIELCTAMYEAQPQKVSVIRLLNLLKPLENINVTDTLPAFEAVDVKGDTITNSFFHRKVSVICLWSTWSYDSQNTLRMVRNIQKEHDRQLAVMSICLNYAPSEGRHVLERDSITWPNICDSTMWQSPLLAQLGLYSVPNNILIGKDGKIEGRNMNNADLREKLTSLLKD